MINSESTGIVEHDKAMASRMLHISLQVLAYAGVVLSGAMVGYVIGGIIALSNGWVRWDC